MLRAAGEAGAAKMVNHRWMKEQLINRSLKMLSAVALGFSQRSETTNDPNACPDDEDGFVALKPNHQVWSKNMCDHLISLCVSCLLTELKVI